MKLLNELDEYILTDLIFDTNLSVQEIARELDTTEVVINKAIRSLGLGWVRRTKSNVSRGQASLTSIMRKLLPGEKIVNEEHIGERLRLDVYCPSYKLAAEYHGRQHFEFVPHFHVNKEGFRESQRRDERKIEICNDLGIALVIFRYNDILDEDSVFSRLLTALEKAPVQEREPRKSIKGDPYYEAWKIRQREYRREAYRKMKGLRGRS